MILGFKHNEVNYLIVSALDRTQDNFLRRVLKCPTNYPIKKIDAIKGCVVASNSGSYELLKLVDILENLGVDKLDYDIIYNEVFPRLRKEVLSEKGIDKDMAFNTSLIIYYDHTYYSLLTSGMVAINKTTAISQSILKRNIALEAIDKYKNLSPRELISKIDSLIRNINEFSIAPYFIYKDDGSDEIEVVEVTR